MKTLVTPLSAGSKQWPSHRPPSCSPSSRPIIADAGGEGATVLYHGRRSHSTCSATAVVGYGAFETQWNSNHLLNTERSILKARLMTYLWALWWTATVAKHRHYELLFWFNHQHRVYPVHTSPLQSHPSTPTTISSLDAAMTTQFCTHMMENSVPGVWMWRHHPPDTISWWTLSWPRRFPTCRCCSVHLTPRALG